MRTVALSLLALLGVVSALQLHSKSADLQLDKDRSEPIFYMTAMDKLANKHQTRLWLSSVRHSGQWKGEVVIVTDHPDCLEQNLGKDLLGGGKIESTDTMNVYPGGEGMGKVYFLKLATTKNVREMKEQKSMAWKNMAKLGLNPSFIVYTDQDIVFGNDVNHVIRDAKANLQGRGYTMALFRDQGQSKGEMHTGIIFMFPSQATDKCLEEWSAKILTIKAGKYHGFNSVQEGTELSEEPAAIDLTKQDAALDEAAGEKVEAEMMGPDQRALGKTHSCKEGSGIAFLDSSFLMMPTKSKLNSRAKATFLHFTNTNRWKAIGNEVMKKYFVETLGLKPQEWFEYEKC